MPCCVALFLCFPLASLSVTIYGIVPVLITLSTFAIFRDGKNPSTTRGRVGRSSKRQIKKGGLQPWTTRRSETARLQLSAMVPCYRRNQSVVQDPSNYFGSSSLSLDIFI